MKNKYRNDVSRRQFLTVSSMALAAGVAGLQGRTAQAVAGSKNRIGVAGMAGGKDRVEFRLSDLPYAPDALEPHIDARTMEIHHGRHHAAYVNNLVRALEPYPELQRMPLAGLMEEIRALPDDIRTTVRNNGGGHYNHDLFWNVMAPDGGGEPAGALAEALARDFGSFDAMRDAFSGAAAGVFGSGWAWLIRKDDGTLAVTSTPNQDNPLMQGIAEVTGTPLLGLDVWEHAYYLHYQNRRGDYIEAWWNVVNWPSVQSRYELAGG